MEKLGLPTACRSQRLSSQSAADDSLANHPNYTACAIIRFNFPSPQRELLTPETNGTSSGLSPWQAVRQAVKWLAYALLSSFGALFLWVLKDQFSEKPSPKITSALGALKTHEVLSLLAICSFLALCAGLWLLASRKEALEKIVETGLVFVPSAKLRHDHLRIVAFKPLYVAHAEVVEAQQKLSSEQRLLILGRPSGGKTRLAFNLARQAKRHWILRVYPGFFDWKSLNFPRIPHRCKVLWIVDDVNEFLGKSDIGQGERVLSGRCDLKIIVTCRAGYEIEQARSDKELAAFLERFPTVTCSDFTRAELVSLARQVGKPASPDLYDFTPGSVLLGLAEMRERLQHAVPEAQAVMRAMFLPRTALIFIPKKSLSPRS